MNNKTNGKCSICLKDYKLEDLSSCMSSQVDISEFVDYKEDHNDSLFCSNCLDNNFCLTCSKNLSSFIMENICLYYEGKNKNKIKFTTLNINNKKIFI